MLRAEAYYAASFPPSKRDGASPPGLCRCMVRATSPPHVVDPLRMFGKATTFRAGEDDRLGSVGSESGGEPLIWKAPPEGRKRPAISPDGTTQAAPGLPARGAQMNP
jgi:hypothetical protein